MSRTARLLAVFTLAAAAMVAAPTSVSAHASHGRLPFACDFAPTLDGVPCSEVDRAVGEAADEFGIDHARFRRMIACESHFRPAVDSNYPYVGLTQQGSEFWRRWVPRFNYVVAVDLGDRRPYASRYHPFDNARLAAYVISLNGYDEWECKGY